MGVLLGLNPCLSYAQAFWREARSEHYSLVGNTNEDVLKEVAIRLEGFRVAVLRVFDQTQYRSLEPTTVFLFQDRQEWKGLGIDDELDGHFLPGRLNNFIVLIPETKRTNPFIPIFHDYFHAIVNENIPNIPLWLLEGLAEFYSTLEWSEDNSQLLIGRPINPHVRLVRDNRTRLRFDELFAVDRKSRHYDERDRDRIFYAQSWAFVHFLMTRNQGAGEREVTNFVQMMASGRSFEDAIEGAFRVKSTKLLLEFENHLDQRGPLPYLTMATSSNPIVSVMVSLKEVSSAKVLGYLGEFLAQIGQLEMAESYLGRAIGEDKNLVSVRNSLSTIRIMQGRFSEARKFLEKTIQNGEGNYLSHFYYALSLLREHSDISGDLLSVARNELREAIRLESTFPQSYHELALTYLHREEELPEAVNLLDRALNLRTGNQRYLFALSRALIAQEAYDTARTVLLPLLDERRTSATRQHAQEIIASIEDHQDGVGLRGEGYREIRASVTESQKMMSTVESSTLPTVELTAGVTDDRVQMTRFTVGEQLQGWLNLIDCRDGLTLTVLTDDDSFLFHADEPDRVEFSSSTSVLGTELRCGPIDPPMPVIVTFRELIGGSSHDGIPLKVEFIDEPGSWY